MRNARYAKSKSSRPALVVGTLVLATAIGGCAQVPMTPGGAGARPAAGPEPLNRISASQVVGAMSRAGLAAPNPRDVTEQQCPKLHCAQAIDTDTVSVFKFPATGLAQKYAGSISNVFQVEDLVVVFGPSMDAERKQDYENVVERIAQ